MKKLLPLLLILSASGFAKNTIHSYEEFKKIAVLDNGRKKPLDTFARSKLLQLSARSSFGGAPAIEWLAKTLFTPALAQDDKIFRVNNPEVVQALGVESEKHFRYSFTQLRAGFQKLNELALAASKVKENERSAVESEFMRLYGNLNMFAGLLNSFQFALPHPDFAFQSPATAVRLGLDSAAREASFLDLMLALPEVSKFLDQFSPRPPSAWTAEEREVFTLSKSVYRWSQTYRNLPPEIFPGTGTPGEPWTGPWEAIASHVGDEPFRSEILHLRALALAYLQGSQAEFDMAVRAFNRSALARSAAEIHPSKLNREISYNSLDPFYRAKVCYGFSMLLGFLALLGWRKWLLRGNLLLLVSGFSLHLLGIALRMNISGRPPITNLFETFIFVAAVCVLLGLVLERFNKRGVGLLTGSISALSLLLISGKYSAEGDTLNVLVAVLDSNFWLSTHVVAINIGYAGVCVAGVIGHLWLIQALFRPGDGERLHHLSRLTYGTLGFGIIFTFIGTVLGGIWADQSWGRFWGWDPKENGALLIVLWCALLFHARLGKMIGPLGLAVGSALGITVVMMAWFGINLLGVGLHSYGFTSGVLKGLLTFVAAEAIFLLLTALLLRKRLRKA